MNTLAEIVAEGERLPLGNDEEAFNTRGAWVSVYLPRLLAVAKAGVEMRAKLSIRYFEDAAGEQDHQWVLHEGLEEALAAFDAAREGVVRQ